MKKLSFFWWSQDVYRGRWIHQTIFHMFIFHGLFLKMVLSFNSPGESLQVEWKACKLRIFECLLFKPEILLSTFSDDPSTRTFFKSSFASARSKKIRLFMHGVCHHTVVVAYGCSLRDFHKFPYDIGSLFQKCPESLLNSLSRFPSPWPVIFMSHHVSLRLDTLYKRPA